MILMFKSLPNIIDSVGLTTLLYVYFICLHTKL